MLTYADVAHIIPDSAEDKLEQRLRAVETPEDDVSRLDQVALLTLLSAIRCNGGGRLRRLRTTSRA